MRLLALTAALGILGLTGASAQASVSQGFWLRNTDPSAEFVWWTVEGVSPGTAAQVLPALLVAPGGRHAAAPGERVRIVPGPGRSVVGVFVPWADSPGYLTPLSGGFLLPQEWPSRGTLLVDRPGFAAANRGRALEAPLQAWGLTLPGLVLDGRTSDWFSLPSLAEWGPAFRPGLEPWPAAWPRPVSLAAALRDGALWLRFTADRPWTAFPAGLSASLALRRPGTSLEWPLTGTDPVVWSWAGDRPDPAGHRILAGRDLEARVPLDRLDPDRLKVLGAGAGSWVLMTAGEGGTRSFDLGPFSWEDLE